MPIVKCSSLLVAILAAGCSRGGPPPSSPRPPPPAVIVRPEPTWCLTQAPPPPTPGPPPILRTIAEVGDVTAEQLAALFARIEVLEASTARLERRVARDWRLCGPHSTSSPASPATNP